jgi:hypothetical protein
MTDKRTNKRCVSTKRTPVAASHRPPLNNLSHVVDYCDVETPPASSSSDWAEVHAKAEAWGVEVEDADVCEASPVDSIVGSPKELPRHEEDSMQNHLLQVIERERERLVYMQRESFVIY